MEYIATKSGRTLDALCGVIVDGEDAHVGCAEHRCLLAEKVWDTAKIGLSASALGQLIIEQACQSEGCVLDRARAWCESHSIPFFRFSPQFSREVTLDCVHDETLVEMLWGTRAYVESEQVKLRRLAKRLKQRM